MASVYEVFNLKKIAGDVGIEIEVEGANLPRGTAHWRKEADGSLKPLHEAAEYVMNTPVPINKLQGVLDELKEAFTQSRAKVDNTYRAGIHTHVNVQDLTMTQVINLVCLFIIFEDFYVNFCDKSRKGNHFCLRTKDAGYFVEAVAEACENGRMELARSDDLRYSAINIQSLFKYGSIEFRSLESTMDFKRVVTWSNMLMKLKKAAVRFKDPKEILHQISFDGYDILANSVLEEYSDKFFADMDWRGNMREGVLRCQDIAYSRNWEKVSLNIFLKKENIW